VLEGPEAIQANYVAELGRIRAAGDLLNGGAPTLIGECGIPYDLNGAEAYRRWSDGERGPNLWDAHETALHLMYNALDTLLLSSTQWNYTASNRNDPMIGDGWNQEDLSIWSIDQVDNSDPHAGGRAVPGFSRPYVRAAQGRLLAQRFDRFTGSFDASIECDPACGETEVVLPLACYPGTLRAWVDGSPLPGTVHAGILTYRHSGRGTFNISVRSDRLVQ
jgi:hypothetical protein